MPDFGYAGEILKVDLSNGKVEKLESKEYTDRFIGGHGVAAKLYRDFVPPAAKADSAENCLIAASGPAAGFPGFAGGRWKLCAKTPLNTTDSFNYGNFGERWGSYLKFAGYDALVVQGKAEKPVYLYIHDGKIDFKDASHLRGLSTFDATDEIKTELGKGVSVLAVGQAGENGITFSVVQAEGASGSGGMGAVMGYKNLKAIAVAGNKRPVAAHPERVRELIDIIRNGRNKTPVPSWWGIPGVSRAHACYGCGIGCTRELYPAEKGRDYKALCQATNMYIPWVMRYKYPKADSQLLATRLCDGYGLDTIVMEAVIRFLEACYQEGVLDEKRTGLPLSKIGTPEFIRELTRMIAMREGFGKVLAKGVIEAAKEIGLEAEKLLSTAIATPGGEKKDYDPRLLISTAISYATEPRRSISQTHDIVNPVMMWMGMGPEAKPGSMLSAENLRRIAEKAWGGALAVDFSTYQGKALSAKMIQDRVAFKESMVLCDLRWTMTMAIRLLGTTTDNVTEAQVYSAITGKDMDEVEMMRTGERIFNLQRTIMLRDGRRGRKDDVILDYYFTEPVKENELFWNFKAMVPGKDGEVMSKLGATLDRDRFNAMMSEYYALRGWDDNGYPTQAKLHELGLGDMGGGGGGRGK